MEPAWLTCSVTSAARRSIAFAVLAGVFFIAALTPRFTGRVISGTPQATAITEQPAVGDCVTDPIEPSWSNHRAQFDQPGMSASTYRYPAMNVSQCSGSRFGEVVSIIANPVKPVVTSYGTSVSITDTNMDSCSAAADTYVGRGIATPQPAPIPTQWSQASPVVGVAASSPSVRQKAAGQHWLACIVFVQATGGTATQLRAQQQYDQSLRKASTTGHERDRLGICYPGEDLSPSAGYGLGACGSDHRSEVFAVGSTETQIISRTKLESTCREEVRRITNIPSNTSGVTVRMQANDSDGHLVQTAQIPAKSSLSCGVVVVGAVRHLTASLLAWGTEPLPWK